MKKRRILDAFRLSFRSESPLKTAGMFFNNMQRVYPVIRTLFLKTLARTFKNMILEEGETNVVIRGRQDYVKTQQTFAECFKLTPPPAGHIFNMILEQERNLSKIARDLELFFIGVGSAFTKRQYQTNLLIVKGDDHLLIDCGTKCSQAFHELGVPIGEVKNFLILD